MNSLKGFAFGFMTAIFLLQAIVTIRNVCAVSSQIATDYTDAGNIGNEFNSVYQNLQKKTIISVVKSTPTTMDFEQGQVFISTASGKAWTRIQNDRYFWTITKF